MAHFPHLVSVLFQSDVLERSSTQPPSADQFHNAEEVTYLSELQCPICKGGTVVPHVIPHGPLEPNQRESES